jgi:hypothetical protein
MLAIMKNNIEDLEFLMTLKNGNDKVKAGASLDHQDNYGMSAAHYVVKPLKFGSYENVDIMKMLHQHKFNL